MSLTLVTGGCGFIGRHLAEALLVQGRGVRVLDLAEPHDLPEAVEYHHGSILDAGRLGLAMQNVTQVFHIAGLSHFWTRRMDVLDEVNAGGTRMVLAAAAAAGVRRVVHCSTEVVLLSMCRPRGTPASEERLPPLAELAGPYTRSKHAAEQAALAAVREGLDVVIASPTIPIGAGDYNLTPPAAMLARFLDGKAPLYLDCTLNLVDVRDLATGFLLAAERGRRGERYVLGGDNLTMRDLLDRVEKLSGRKMPSLPLPGPVALTIGAVSEWIATRVTGIAPPATREGVQLALWSAPFESRKARTELGYRPRPVDAALAETLRWLMDGPETRRPLVCAA